MSGKVEIPIDVYDSEQEILIVIPLWWVGRDSIEVFLEKTNLIVKWNRVLPNLKETLSPVQQDCFWWEFSNIIQLPHNVYFDKIQTSINKENILLITVPKIIIPEKIKLEIKNM